MATAGGPNIERDGLVFGYDTGYGVADNSTSTRFYPGEPSVNLLPSGPALGTGNFSRQAAHNESFTYSKVTNYKGRADVHRLYINPTGNTADPYADYGGQYHKSGGSAVGDVYAVSLDFYVAKGNNSPSLGSVYADGYKSPTSSGAASISGNSDTDLGDGWTRRTRIITITTAGNTWLRFGCNTSGNETEIYIDNVQVELKSHATPFVDGTRSSTQSLIDLKRTADIDIGNVSFDSNGQPTFDGTNDYIDVTSMSGFSLKNITIIAKPFENITPSYLGYYPQWMEQSGFYIAQGPWTGGATNETFHIWNSNGTMTHIRDNISNDWHQFVWNWNGTTYDCYIDGIQKTTYARSNGHAELIVINTNTLRLGANFSTYFYKGDMAVIKMYNRALTATEVQQNFNAYKNRFDI